MSDTPLTDAEGVRFARIMIEWPKPGQQQVTELIPADFARGLERELAAANAALRDVKDFVHTEWLMWCKEHAAAISRAEKARGK